MDTRTNTALAALAFLSSVCDGAASQDGAGFSGADVEFGKDLARKGERYGLSEKQHAHAKRLAHKYRRQLVGAGFDLATIAGEVWTAGLPPAAQAPDPGYVAPARPVNGWANRFAGRCGCGVAVPAGTGKCDKIGSRWVTWCGPCALGHGEPMVAIRVVGPHGETLPA